MTSDIPLRPSLPIRYLNHFVITSFLEALLSDNNLESVAMK